MFDENDETWHLAIPIHVEGYLECWRFPKANPQQGRYNAEVTGNCTSSDSLLSCFFDFARNWRISHLCPVFPCIPQQNIMRPQNSMTMTFLKFCSLSFLHPKDKRFETFPSFRFPRPVSQPVLLEPSETKTSHKQRACRCKWRSGKWEAKVGFLDILDEFVRWCLVPYTSYLHILEIYTLYLIFLSWFCHDLVIFGACSWWAGAWGWRWLKLGELSPKSCCSRELWERSDPSDGFLYSTCSFLVNILYTTFPWFLCYSAIDSKNKSFLNPFWFLYTGFIVLAIIQEKCPPARLAWIFVCSGCRNLIPKDQFLSVSSQSRSNIN